MSKHKLLTVALTLVLVVGTLPTAAMAMSAPAGGPASATADATFANTVATQPTENESGNETVNVTVGSQLSTVLQVTNTEIGSEVNESAFEYEFESADNESARAEAVTERAEALADRAADIHEDYREVTRAYEAGEITGSQYAQRLATLNARAETLIDAVGRLEGRAGNVSAFELRAEGYRAAEVTAATSRLDNISGAGVSALLRRFTGQSQGQIELETAGGLRIEVESEDGEQVREIERERDDNRNFTVSQSAALETARSALSTPANGTWVLVDANVKVDDGAYEFEFALRGDSARTGETEIRVDGSSGVVYRLEEKTESRDDSDDESEHDRENESADGELTVLVAEGTPAPNETVTLRVLADGSPVEGATVTMNDRAVGTTDASGAVTVTLPDRGEAELTARSGEREGELEFEFGDDERERETLERALDASASVDDGTVTVRVTYEGGGVAGATVTANGERVGTTDDAGRVTFATPDDAELELTVTRGEFEAEFTFTADGDGGFSLAETDLKDGGEREEESEDEREEEGEDEDGDDDEREDEDDEREDDETDEPDEEETDEPDTPDDDETDTPEDDR